MFGRQSECRQLTQKLCTAPSAAKLGCVWGATADKTTPASCNSQDWIQWR